MWSFWDWHDQMFSPSKNVSNVSPLIEPLYWAEELKQQYVQLYQLIPHPIGL